MCLLYLIALLIVIFIIWKIISNNNNKNNRVHNRKIVESFIPNTVSFTDPQNMFFKAMNDIKNSDKIVLENVVSKCYLDKNIIEPVLNDKVIDILKNVISHFNNILKENEYYINKLEGLYIIKDDKENYRLIVSSFIYDVKNFYTVKFIMDVVFMNNEYYLNYLNIDERATNNILNQYDVRQVNNHTEGILLSYDMVNDDLEDTLNVHYKTNNNILDFVNTENKQYNFFKLDDLSKYYLPGEVSNVFSPIFCDKDSDNYNTNGVPEQNKNIPESCIANNNAITKILNQPYDAPGVLYGDKTSEYSWLFNIFSNPGIMTGNPNRKI